MARWKQLELAVFATQLYDKHIVGDGRDVFYDVWLPNPDGNMRRVDVAVSDSTGQMIRIFEVQDRDDALGSDGLGGFIDKLAEVGVQSLTTVTRSGYTRPAIDRLGRSPQVTALELRTPRPDSRLHELDMVEVTYDLGPESGPTQLAVLNFELASVSLVAVLEDAPALDVAFGISSNEQWTFIVALCVRPDGWVGMMVSPLVMPHEPTTVQDAPLVLHFRNGRTETYPPSELLEQRRP